MLITIIAEFTPSHYCNNNLIVRLVTVLKWKQTNFLVLYYKYTMHLISIFTFLEGVSPHILKYCNMLILTQDSDRWTALLICSAVLALLKTFIGLPFYLPWTTGLLTYFELIGLLSLYLLCDLDWLGRYLEQTLPPCSEWSVVEEPLPQWNNLLCWTQGKKKINEKKRMRMNSDICHAVVSRLPANERNNKWLL